MSIHIAIYGCLKFFDYQLLIPVLTLRCTIDDLYLHFVNAIILSISLNDPGHTWPSIYKNSWHPWTEFSFYQNSYE